MFLLSTPVVELGLSSTGIFAKVDLGQGIPLR